MQSGLLVGIAGGSGSGKTTLAQALLAALEGAALIQHDAYYRHRPQLPFEERCRVNYDHPDSLETELLAAHLEALRSGRPIRRPVYNFTTHLRSRDEVEVGPSAVIVVEGILLLADADLRQLFDLKIYVDTEPDIRLARRLGRDVVERGRTAESVLEQWEATVLPMHLRYVEPSKRHADLVVSEGLHPAGVEAVVEAIRSRRIPTQS